MEAIFIYPLKVAEHQFIPAQLGSREDAAWMLNLDELPPGVAIHASGDVVFAAPPDGQPSNYGWFKVKDIPGYFKGIGMVVGVGLDGEYTSPVISVEKLKELVSVLSDTDVKALEGAPPITT